MQALFPLGDVDLLDAYHLSGGKVVTFRAFGAAGSPTSREGAARDAGCDGQNRCGPSPGYPYTTRGGVSTGGISVDLPRGNEDADAHDGDGAYRADGGEMSKWEEEVTLCDSLLWRSFSWSASAECRFVSIRETLRATFERVHGIVAVKTTHLDGASLPVAEMLSFIYTRAATISSGLAISCDQEETTCAFFVPGGLRYATANPAGDRGGHAPAARANVRKGPQATSPRTSSPPVQAGTKNMLSTPCRQETNLRRTLFNHGDLA